MRTRTGRGLATALTMAWLGLAGPAPAAAQGAGRTIALQGNGRGAQACATCHGETGAGDPAMGAPRLSILPAGYMAAQLDAFRAGRRSNPLMTPVAKALSDEEGRAVSAYYATAGSEGGDGGPGAVPDTIAGDTALGRRLAHRGDWSRTIPPCVSCHGPDAAGVAPGFPALGGQHAGYLLGQLVAWRDDRRGGDPLNLMGAIADRLTDEEARAVAVYLATLVPPGRGDDGAPSAGAAAAGDANGSAARATAGSDARPARTGGLR